MNKETYKSRRAELIRDFYRLRSIHCLLSAKDRIRKIALLDFQQLGIPIEETKKLFGYNSKTFESCQNQHATAASTGIKETEMLAFCIGARTNNNKKSKKYEKR